jgi:bacteriocin-like protein
MDRDVHRGGAKEIDMNDDKLIEMKEIDASELASVEGGYYGPCGCIPFPFPFPECPAPEDPPIVL